MKGLLTMSWEIIKAKIDIDIEQLCDVCLLLGKRTVLSSRTVDSLDQYRNHYFGGLHMCSLCRDKFKAAGMLEE